MLREPLDPENPADLKRLFEDLPIVKALAAFAIEHELGVKSAATVYREHLYELEGFRSLFGEALVVRLKGREAVQTSEIPLVPSLRVRLHQKPDYAPLLNLTPTVIDVRQGVVQLDCVSTNNRTRMLLGLDFPNERLEVNTIEGLISLADGTEAALRDAVAVMEFKRAYFANGELIISREENGQLMGRCAPFLPMNVDMGATLRNFDTIIERYAQLAEQRALASVT